MYMILVSAAAVLSVIALFAILRRSSGSSRGADLSNVTVSREWLIQHQSHDL